MRGITTEVHIAAPPDRVWAVLRDITAWGAWNPVIRIHAGTAAVGSRLKVEMTPPGMQAMRFTPTVREVQDGRELRWLGRVGLPGIFDGEHRFHLEAEGTGTRLRHSEEFRGLLVPLVMRGRMLAATREMFAVFNAKLKARVESL